MVNALFIVLSKAGTILVLILRLRGRAYKRINGAAKKQGLAQTALLENELAGGLRWIARRIQVFD